MAGSLLPCPNHKAVTLLKEKKGVQAGKQPDDRIKQGI
jgi:hypothetical protein